MVLLDINSETGSLYFKMNQKLKDIFCYHFAYDILSVSIAIKQYFLNISVPETRSSI